MEFAILRLRGIFRNNLVSMEETNDVQALEKISSEVDESQIKVILSSQCIKGMIYTFL